jgi:hypothetical protein
LRDNGILKQDLVFHEINGYTVWWALYYVLRGHNVFHFNMTPMASLINRWIRKALKGSPSFQAVDFQVANHKGLNHNSSRFALDALKECSGEFDSAAVRKIFESAKPAGRVEAFLKRTTSRHLRSLFISLAIYTDIAAEESTSPRFVLEGQKLTKYFLDVYSRDLPDSLDVKYVPAIPARAVLLFQLVKYLSSTILRVFSKGISLNSSYETFDLSKQAIASAGNVNITDQLVDGEIFHPSDLLLYHNSNSGKREMRQAVEESREAGIAVAAWDRVSVRLKWLTEMGTITFYLLQPLWLTLYCLLPGRNPWVFEAARLSLQLRRSTFGWDIFFAKYRVRCVIIGDSDEHIPATIAIERWGGKCVGIELSDELDEFGRNFPYRANHSYFVWGEGIAELWRRNWLVDEIVITGYVWGHLYQASPDEREDLRLHFGAYGGKSLVAMFDTSLARDSYAGPDNLLRFYESAYQLADSLKDAVIVIKPKNPAVGGQKFAEAHLGENPGIVWVDSSGVKTVDLVSSADVVVSMGLTSVGVESLITGTPAIIFDETGRDYWDKTLARPDLLVVDNAGRLVEAAGRILRQGMDEADWAEIRNRIAWNYGPPDGLAISRIRGHIARMCGKEMPTVTANKELVTQEAT